MPRLRALLLVVFALASPASLPAVETPRVTLVRTAASVRLSTGRAVAEVRLARHRLRVQAGGKGLVREPADGGLFYERAGATHQLGAVREGITLDDGVRLLVDTDEGMPATVRLRFSTRRALEVTFVPPAPDTVTAIGARLLSPASEHIYGLTERLRDSPPLSPPVIDIPADDIVPPEVGSLDRRGERVEMRVLPTFSVYAPFYQSSLGYGLAVSGTTFGVFDLARSDPGVIRFRFEAGTRAFPRDLVFHVLVGPDYATILDEYTLLAGRPIVPPPWAFLHWRWRDALDPGTALLDGVAVNAQVADDVLMYEALGIPPGVYHFDRPVLQGNYGFARWAWDETRLPNPQAMLDALKHRGYRLMIWSGAWMCGSDPGDNGLEAQTLGFLAPRPTGAPPAAPFCDDVTGTDFILDVTNPDARTWWQGKMVDFLRRYGIQGIKLDRGEEHIPSEATDRWADGRTGREVRNDYARLQARIHHDALAEVWGDDFVLVSRPSYTGT